MRCYRRLIERFIETPKRDRTAAFRIGRALAMSYCQGDGNPDTELQADWLMYYMGYSGNLEGKSLDPDDILKRKAKRDAKKFSS